MAKKKKLDLLSELSKEDGISLGLIMTRYVPPQYREKFQESLAATGKAPDELFEKAGLSAKDKNFIQDLLAGLNFGNPQELESKNYEQFKKDIFSESAPDIGSARENLNERDFLDLVMSKTTNPVDESQLTDDELRSRKAQFEARGGLTGLIDKAGLQRELQSALLASGLNNEAVASDIAGRIADLSEQVGGYPSVEQLVSIFPNRPPWLENFFNNQTIRNRFSDITAPQLNVSDPDSVKRLEDIISGRELEAGRRQAEDVFIENLPMDLESSREEFLGAKEKAARGELQKFASTDALQAANQRGALFSGDVGDYISDYAVGLEGDLEQVRADLEAEDDAFYANAAYRAQLKKELSTRTDYLAAIEQERARIRGEQETRFLNKEAALDRNLREDLTLRNYEQALRAAQVRAERTAKSSSAASGNRLYGNIGTAVGATAGLVFSGFNPAGAAGGAQAGRQAAEIGLDTVG